MPGSQLERDEGELRRLTDNAILAKAFQLAHSMYRFRKRDRRIALTIVSEALNSVKVRLIAQHEADRHDPHKPTKVRWNNQQWFQLLIYCKSEAFERLQESNKSTSLSHEDMIIRYIKHLILTTSRRNSFHTCLGLSRLVYGYTASETMSIYDLVFQDPDASTKKSDAYYRGRKNKLIEELAMRFDRFVRIEVGLRGEKKFESDDDSPRFAQLLREYLTRFTPWETACKLPPHLDTWTTVHSLQFSQRSQIHSLIHPNCFVRITKALNLGDPESRLALPQFFLERDESDEGASPEDPPSELTSREAAEIIDKIAQQEYDRKKFVSKSLSILVDRKERARIDLSEASQVHLDIESDVTLIELVGHTEKGDLLLATHLVTHDEDSDDRSSARNYSIVLEGGQKISLVMIEHGESGGFSVEITYQQAKANAYQLWWQKLKHQLSATRRGQDQPGVPALAFRLGLAALVLTGTVFALYLVLRNDSGEQIAKHEAQNSLTEPLKSPTQASGSPAQTAPTIQHKPSASPTQAVPGPSTGNLTRDPTVRAVNSINEVRRIYIESFGDDEFSRNVRQELNERLQVIQRFEVVTRPDEADTAVAAAVRRTGTSQDENGQIVSEGNVRIRLLNVNGKIIWTRAYRGIAQQVAAQFASELLAGIDARR